jgi:hypothetical protein
MDCKAKREAQRQLATLEAEAHKVAHAKHAEAAHQAKTVGVIATFAKRAKEASLAAGATPEDAEIAVTTCATRDDATAFADTTTMQK